MRIGINGYGQVGRRLVERLESDSRFELAAVNELAPVPTRPMFRGREVPWFARREPADLPWARGEIEVDVVVEASMWFHRREMVAQSRRGRIVVVMTGDLRKSRPDLSFVPGVDDERLKATHRVICSGSDRTQSLAPLLTRLHRWFELTNVHACFHRTPYSSSPGRIVSERRFWLETTRVAPELRSVRRGRIVRIEQSGTTGARMWLDAEVLRPPTRAQLHARLAEWAEAAPRFLWTGAPAPAVADRVESLVIDASRVDVDGKRIWLEACYDPVPSYVERLIELLGIVRERGRHASPRRA